MIGCVFFALFCFASCFVFVLLCLYFWGNGFFSFRYNSEHKMYFCWTAIASAKMYPFTCDVIRRTLLNFTELDWIINVLSLWHSFEFGQVCEHMYLLPTKNTHIQYQYMMIRSTGLKRQRHRDR